MESRAPILALRYNYGKTQPERQIAENVQDTRPAIHGFLSTLVRAAKRRPSASRLWGAYLPPTQSGTATISGSDLDVNQTYHSPPALIDDVDQA